MPIDSLVALQTQPWPAAHLHAEIARTETAASIATAMGRGGAGDLVVRAGLVVFATHTAATGTATAVMSAVSATMASQVLVLVKVR